jgi:hypothetical protein
MRETGGLLSGWKRSVTKPNEANVKKMARDTLNTERRGSDLQNRRLSRFIRLHPRLIA